MNLTKPELLLYTGVCSANDCPERESFNLETADKHTLEIYDRAIQTVNLYLDYGWGVDFSGMYNLVKSEKEAQELISLLHKSIEGVGPLLKIKKSMHGMISFDRKAEFSQHQHTYENINELIEQMKDLECMTNKHISSKRLEYAFYSDKMY